MVIFKISIRETYILLLHKKFKIRINFTIFYEVKSIKLRVFNINYKKTKIDKVKQSQSALTPAVSSPKQQPIPLLPFPIIIGLEESRFAPVAALVSDQIRPSPAPAIRNWLFD
jgi:hypothetical protein